MPETKVIHYREEDGTIPLEEWFDRIPAGALDRCLARLELLEQRGHELRRPHAEYIEGTDLYELRAKHFSVNYRMIYFFHGRESVVVSHGFTKEREIPPREIALASERMKKFLADPKRHTPPDEEQPDG